MKTATQYKAAIYVRLSKEDEAAATSRAAESNSIANQKQLILDYVKDKPELNIVSIRVDDGYTGTNYDRPDFQRMMDDIKAGVVNCVIVKDLSRFGREYINAGRYIDRLFPYYGVRLIAINDSIDTITRSAADDFSITLKNLMNDNYCRDISIKVRSQLQVKRRNGEYVGAFAPYGYRKREDDHNSLEIDPYAAEVVQDIFCWKIEGMSANNIAKKLTEMGVLSPLEYKRSQGMKYKSGFKRYSSAKWGAVPVLRILTNPAYIGTMIQGTRTKPNYKVKKEIINDEENWVVINNAFEPIISDKTFMLVKRILQLDTRTPPHGSKVYPLAGLIVCGKCKGPTVRKTTKTGGKTYAYYVCANRKEGETCYGYRISEPQMEQAVLSLLQKHIEMLVELQSCIEVIGKAPLYKAGMIKTQSRIDKLDAELERYKQLKTSAYEDFVEGILTKGDYLDIRSQYDSRMADVLLAKEQVNRERETYMNNSTQPQQWIQDFIEHRNIQSLTRRAAVECIEEIVMYDNRAIEVTFTHAQDYEEILAQIQEVYTVNNDKEVG